MQWYPFTRLSKHDKAILVSEKYFNEVIKTGVFLYYPENFLTPNNYIMKSDGNFRNASLVSPLMYLLLLTIGKSISKRYHSFRPHGIEVFYAGNYNENRLYYRKDYDIFFKTINELSQSYRYFIKTDIKDFFSNIDVNLLFDKIDYRFSKTGTPISQKDLLIYKELIQCLGQGEFPLIENSVASSYLATVIYLEHPDICLYEFIDNKETEITDFYMVRYVDDLYILFNSDKPENTLTPVINRVIDTYSSELKKINLSLNRSKTTWKKVSEINVELKKSLYDEQFNNKEFYITDLVDSSVLLKFLQYALTNCILDTSKYQEIINSVFCFPNTEYTPDEIFNSLIYEKHQMFGDSEVVDKLFILLDYDYRFLKLDTKRLMILVLKTKNENLIKQMLSNLFEANRDGVWDIYDTSLAINYLLQRNFRHRDLLNVLKKEEGYVYSYYDLFCRLSFMRTMEVSRQNYIQKFIETIYYKKDDKLFFLYFMYMIELKKRNYLSAFAYYKNFFDRISAHLGLAANKDSTKKGKPNYNNYYKEGVLKTLYGDILGSGNIIKKAHEIRNANPLSHSSAELIDDNNTSKDILESIGDLETLLKSKVEIIIKNQAVNTDFWPKDICVRF